MANEPGKYETVIGLEVHAQLLTKSKLFCGDSTAFGDEPNTQVSPITLAHPGTLPKMNRKAIEYAIRMGLACESTIEKDNYFARKNYFYPDLPKGYQVSQHTTPICRGGIVRIKTGDGQKEIRLNRIHLEEDAGKSIHDIDEHFTSIDFNRAGTPLIEIVSEPDLRSGDEAYAYLTAIRKLVRYLGICDGNMEEGSLRCDANISVRRQGDTELGTRVEVKNLNSIRHVKKAIESESQRLIGILETGESIRQQTLSFNASTGTAFPIRDKEDAEDYRYFPEPDLAPFHLPDEMIERVRKDLPVFQEERIEKYTSEFGLSVYDAGVLTEDREFSDYYQELVLENKLYKSSANWMLGPVRSWLNAEKKEIEDLPLKPTGLRALIELVESGALSFSSASGPVFLRLVENPDLEPVRAATDLNLLQESDHSALIPIVDEVLLKFADKVSEYKKGKKGLLSLFVGEVMKRSKGKADPKQTNDLILERIKTIK